MKGALRWLLFSLGIVLLPLVTHSAYPEESSCSRPKVLVRGEIAYEEDFWEHLQKQYPHRSRESLLFEIRSVILQELRTNSPGVDFVEEGGDCDYTFSYTLSLIAAGEDIEVAGVLEGEYTAFSMSSKLVQNNACGFPGRVVGVSIIQDDPDLFRTIERNIDLYGSLEAAIAEFERTHRVPPRGPVMEFELAKPYVSPKLGEREADIRIRVRNCRGDLVFDRYEGQVVILPRRTERGELKPTKGFPQEFVVTENLVLLKITTEQGGSVTYTLKRGFELGVEEIRAETCGIDKVSVQEVIPPLSIAGVGMEIEPEEVYPAPGESTSIEVRLFKVTPLGEQVPLGDEMVDVEVAGLVDGSLKPQGRVKTDAQGKVLLTYRAGFEEDEVVVTARYRPEGYPEAIEEKTSVALVEKPRCFRGKVDIIVDSSYREAKKDDPSECGREESELTTELRAHVSGELLLRPGQPAEIIAWDFSGTYKMLIKTFREACVTYCRRKGVRGEVPVKPGNWEASETRVYGTLSDKNFQISANVTVDRKTKGYSFSCGFGGLVWKAFSNIQNRYYNACTGEIKEEDITSPEAELEEFSISSGEIQGVTQDLERISGEKVVEYFSPFGGTVQYIWHFESVPCEEGSE